MKKILLVANYLLFILSILFPVTIQAVEFNNKDELINAKVKSIVNEEYKVLPGTDIKNIYQDIKVEILEGEKKGEIVQIQNDYLKLKNGDKIFLSHTKDEISGDDLFFVKEIDRRSQIILLLIIFIATILFFSGKQGLKSLMGLAGSLFVISYILLPAIIKGYPPFLVSTVIATIVLFLAIYLTHGFNKMSTVAFSGTFFAVIITGLLAYFSVYYARLSGFSDDESVYLNFNTNGVLDFSGLLLGGIMIGVLGVLDDIAITQAAVVSELFDSAPHLSKVEVYKKALRVGREHVSALVNTLALAYTGAALPLLLLASTSSSSFSHLVNQEIFATEIVRTIVGSIGLILTVPITTILSVCFLKGYHHKQQVLHSHI